MCPPCAATSADWKAIFVMGFSTNTTKFLVEGKKAGVRFDETLTLGRQEVMVSPQRLEALLRENGFWPPPEGGEAFHLALAGTPWRFETFARALGAKNISSCDFSGYESATLTHDLNQPIPAKWEERFDVVVDGGTLEHVFNFPVAIANCMKMVRVGGHLFLFTPANKYCGHGFYQFSPELFYRVLSRENGFEVKRMVMFAGDAGYSNLLGVKYPFPIDGPWYSVHDPAQIRKRVLLLNHDATILCVLAKRISGEAIFKTTPLQSDYVPQWEGKTPAVKQPGQIFNSETGNPVISWLRKTLPESVCREILPKLAVVVDPFRLWRHRRRNSFHNRETYERV